MTGQNQLGSFDPSPSPHPPLALPLCGLWIEIAVRDVSGWAGGGSGCLSLCTRRRLVTEQVPSIHERLRAL